MQAPHRLGDIERQKAGRVEKALVLGSYMVVAAHSWEGVGMMDSRYVVDKVEGVAAVDKDRDREVHHRLEQEEVQEDTSEQPMVLV